MDYDSGKTVYFIKEYEVPDFQVIPARHIHVKFQTESILLPETSINQQIMDWMDEQDKTDLMIERNLHLIFTYWIYVPTKRLTLVDYLKTLNLSPQLAIDVLAVYKKNSSSVKRKTCFNPSQYIT